MKRYLLWIPVFFICAHLFPQTEIDSGDVSGTWTKENSPYNIRGDIYVQANQLLCIEPGVKVIFHGHYMIQLKNANLMAAGNSKDSILFTMSDTNGFALGDWETGGWNGIRFSGASNTVDSSHFSYCRFEYVKSPGNRFRVDQGVIGVSEIPRLLIRDCIFENNKSWGEGLINIHISNLIIRNNVFIHNRSSKMIGLIEDSPEICWNRFESNDCDYAVLWMDEWNHPRIHHNIFIRNTGNIVINATGNCRPRIYQNWIMNNNTAANICFEKSKAEFLNNLLANNNGCAISLNEDESVIANNTIVNNYGENWESVISLQKTANLITGNIFNGNSSTIDYVKGNSEPIIRYNMFDFDSSAWSYGLYTGIYEHNRENDSPHFVINTGGQGDSFDAEFADFNIAPLPNVVNQGDPDFPDEYLTPDLYDRERIRYGRIDPGAYEANTGRDSIPYPLLRDTILIADTIHVMKSFVIPDDVTLKLSARSVILFHGPDSIVVKGSLQAIGTGKEPILFTRDDTTGFASGVIGNSGWRGIILDNSDGSMDDNPPSIFEHSIFEYVKVAQGTDPNPRGGALTLWYVDNFILNNCEFRYNYAQYTGHAICAWESDFDIEYCSFHHHIEREEYMRATTEFSYGTVNLSGSENRVDHCSFYSNLVGVCPGLLISNCQLVLANSHFYNNETPQYEDFGPGQTGVLYSRGGSDIHIYNCLVNNNMCGIGAMMQFSSSRVVVDNSTFVNNTQPAIGGRRTDISIRNSILFGNSSSDDSASILLLDDNSDPDLYNSLIEGGLQGFRMGPGISYTGLMTDCLNSDPFFVSPTLTSGFSGSSELADWRLLDISPCINTGTPDTAGMNLPLYDLDGNNRIMQERIDIGAYEKSGKPPLVDTNPVGGNFCAGDSIVLFISYIQSDTAFLQWQKDGSDIPGATTENLLLYPADLVHSGNYSCRVRNSFGSVNSLPVFIIVKEPPEILTQPEDAWVETGKQYTLNVLLNGTSPMDIQWTLDDKDLGINIPEYKFTPTDSSHEGAYSCIVSNVCGTVRTEPASIFLAPQICMVTVSTTTGNNLIVWEKKTNAPIMAYNVYRESIAAGIYDKLTTIPFDELSVFVDTVADPTVQAYIYKITAIDTAGNETDADLCKQHKTIHLLVSTNPEFNTTQLEWDRYYGFEYFTYKIYRSNTGADLEEIHSMSSSFNSWTDTTSQTERMYYRIAVEKPDACLPEGGTGKAGTGPYYHALSNMDDNKLRTLVYELFSSERLSIFPNPMKTESTIVFQNPEIAPYRMVITDLAGKVVRIEDGIQADRFTLFREDLKAGNYIIELRGGQVYRGRLTVE